MQKLIMIALALVLASFFMMFFPKEVLKPMNNQSSDSNASVVTLKTSMGDIKLELFPEKAPETVKNFLQYVNDGHYDHTIFHRVIDGFMIQGGGFSPNLSEKRTRGSIKNEAHNGLLNTRGTIAMARTQEVHSATSQFFINVADNAFLDHKGNSPQEYGYCVFGKVVDGMDIVDKIKGVETQTHGPYSDLPCTPIEIVSAKINTGANNCY